MGALLKQKIHATSARFEVEVLGIEPHQDHVHLLFKSKLTLALPKYINALKTITSCEIRRTSPEIKDKLWRNTFWGQSYFLATTGQVTLAVLQQ